MENLELCGVYWNITNKRIYFFVYTKKGKIYENKIKKNKGNKKNFVFHDLLGFNGKKKNQFQIFCIILDPSIPLEQ